LTVLDAVLLGVVQGLTEFLPVSSSAHLVFVQHYIRGFDQSKALLFDVTLHFGTLCSVLVYYRRDLIRMAADMLRPASRAGVEAAESGAPDRRYLFLIILAMILTALIAFPLHDTVEAFFDDPGRIRLIGVLLVVTGILLAMSERIGLSRRGRARLGVVDALVVGIAQGLAVFPGISRSGATISAGLFRGVDSLAAVRFSFLLSAPAILGAVVVEGKQNFWAIRTVNPIPYALGALAAFLVGVAAIKIIVESARRGRLIYFAIYCWVVGGLVAVFA
jgi:undecaprenyl-diphosphatase